MADRVTAAPTDSRDPTDYPYSAVHVQDWHVSRDTIEARDIVTWRSATGGARVQTRTMTLRRDPALFPDPLERQRLAAAPADIVTDPPADEGRPDGVISEPIPHDARALAAALIGGDGTDCRPQMLFDRYLVLAGGYYLDHGARAASLRMLATIPGLTYDGMARDLAGRTGWIFTLTGQRTANTIVLDPSTGVLLTASSAEINAEHPRRYTLYLDRSRTATHDQPPSP